VDPTAPNGLRKRVAGQVVFGRRLPTREEIAQINRSLAALEAAQSPSGPEPQHDGGSGGYSDKLPLGDP